MLLAELTVSNEIALALIAMIGGAMGTLFTLWTKARDACTDSDKASATQLRDQMILNERSLATIALREFERDQARRETERCERELDRWRAGPAARAGPATT